MLALTCAFDHVQETCLNAQNAQMAKLQKSVTQHEPKKTTPQGVSREELDVSKHLKKIIERHIIPCNEFKMRQKPFREHALWTSEVSKIFKPRIDFLAKLNFNLQTRQNAKKCFTYGSAKQFCQELSQIRLTDEDLLVNENGQHVAGSHGTDHPNGGFFYSLVIKEREVVQYCLGMSKMTIIDDNSKVKDYHKLKFVEFLEFLARLSECVTLKLEYKDQSQMPKKKQKKPAEDKDKAGSVTIEKEVVDEEEPEKEELDITEKDHSLSYMQTIRRKLIPSLISTSPRDSAHKPRLDRRGSAQAGVGSDIHLDLTLVARNQTLLLPHENSARTPANNNHLVDCLHSLFLFIEKRYHVQQDEP